MIYSVNKQLKLLVKHIASTEKDNKIEICSRGKSQFVISHIKNLRWSHFHNIGIHMFLNFSMVMGCDFLTTQRRRIKQKSFLIPSKGT